MMRSFTLCGLLLLTGLAQADDTALPNPLTLEYALAQANAESHYQMIAASAELVSAQSQLHYAQSASEWQAYLDLKAAKFDPSPLASNQSTEEYISQLHIEKLLYDFGRSDLLQQSATLKHDAVQAYTSYVIAQRRLDIARQFLAVLLADLRYARDDEAMAIAYVRYHSAQDKHALQQLSDVDLLAAQNLYQNSMIQRAQSEAAQRSNRAVLAELMNQPQQLATQIKRPAFKLQRELADYKVLLDQAMASNPRLLLLQASANSAQKKIQSAEYLTRPSLNAEMDVRNSSIDRISDDDWRATLTLHIPLLEQHSVKAQVSSERSQWLTQRAMLLQQQSQIRLRVLQLWQQIPLLKTRLQQMQTQASYSELYLDRSRALYELEVKTDLGDAMVAMSDTNYQQAEAEFELALAWMELDLITNTTTE